MVKRNVQYMAIAERLHTQIKSKKLKTGTPVKSFREIAEEYGVSVKTARSAVLELVKDDILYLEQGRGTFVKDYSGQERELKIGCTVSAFTGESRDGVTKMLIKDGQSAIDYLTGHNCSVRHIPNIVVKDSHELAKYIDGLDGFLICAIHVNLSECYSLYKLKIPAVIFHSETQWNLPFNQIVPDHHIAMREMFEHIKPGQYDHIIVLHQYYKNHMSRRSAFIECAEGAGISKDQLDLREIDEEYAYSEGLKVAATPGRKFIFSVSNRLTGPFHSAMKDQGLTAGSDYDLVTYDNPLETGHIELSNLTYIDYSHKTISATAAKLLITEIRKKTNFTHIIRIPSKLVIKKSAFA